MENVIKSPLKAIKEKCLECSAGVVQEVKLCPCTDCALYQFRNGKNPYLKGRKPLLTEEQRRANTERLKQINAERKCRKENEQ